MWMLQLMLLTGISFSSIQISHSSAQELNAETTPEVQQLHHPHHHHHLLNRHSGPLLQILNYTFTTPEIQLRKGLTHMGSNWRLRRALRHVVHHAGATLNVGAIGGSVTCGHGASKHDVSRYLHLGSSKYQLAQITLQLLNMDRNMLVWLARALSLSACTSSEPIHS